MSLEGIQAVVEAVDKRWGRGWANVIFGGGLILASGVALATIYSLLQGDQTNVSVGAPQNNITINTGPTVAPITEPLADIVARMQVEGHSCAPGQGGKTELHARFHTISKFQRSGVTLLFRAKDLFDPVQLVPLNGQPTWPTLLEGAPTLYRLYLQRPWGQYAVKINMKTKSPVSFTYEFEGDKESAPETLCPS